jgi:thiol-disulfide isomerase/thioredoxin
VKKLILLVIFIPIISFSQFSKFSANNIQEFESWMNYAELENKAVIIDFVADWCGPCKTMDKQLWNSEEFKLLKNYVFIEVDIDKNTSLARKYGITSIPRVIVEVANNQKDVLIDKSGFRSKNQHLGELQYINQFDLKEVYLSNNESEYGSAYRNLFLSDMEKSYTTLLKLSSKHFKKALKKEKNIINQLNIIYNLKLKGSSKKANKNLEKLKLDKANLSESEIEIVQKIITNSI